jgi:hypothetical protein
MAADSLAFHPKASNLHNPSHQETFVPGSRYDKHSPTVQAFGLGGISGFSASGGRLQRQIQP